MRSNSYFTRKRRAVQAACIALFFALAFAAGLAITRSAPEREPDAVFPMANAMVCWEQTFHSGSWGDAGW